MTAIASERVAARAFAVPRGLIAAGTLLGLLWLAATALSIAGEPRAFDAAPDPLNVGWEPVIAIGIAFAALHRRVWVGVLGALAAVGLAVASELLRAAVAAARSDGASLMYAVEDSSVVIAVLMYAVVLIVAVVAAERPRSVVRDLLLAIVLLPFALLTVLWLGETNGLLSAVLAAASGLWLVAILGISRPAPR